MTTIPSKLFVQFIEQGINKGFLQNITKTLDGESYLHEHYIQNHIIKTVEESGKVTIEKLAEELCIEQLDASNVLQKIAKNNDWTIIDDLILTQKYIKEISKSVQNQIDETGHIFLTIQTQQLKLPYSLLKLITNSIESENYIRYSQMPDFIATKKYINECKSSILSELEKLEEPYPTFKLQKSLGIHEELFYLLLEQVMRDNNTMGSLRGKRNRAIFEPKKYKNRQIVLIKSIFDSNECISFNAIENLYAFSNPSDIIADNYEKDQYFCLNSCFIKCSVKEKAKKTIISISEYCDVNDLLPAVLTFEDVHKVMDIIMSEISTASSIDGKSFVVLEGGYIAKADYVQKLVTDSNNYLRNLARSLKQKQNKNHSVNTNLSDNDIIKAFENLGCPHHIAEKVCLITRNSMLNQFVDLLQTPYVEADSITSDDQWIIKHKSIIMKKLENIRQSIYFNYEGTKQFRDSVSQASLEKFILKNQCTEYLFNLVIYSVLDQSYNKAEVAQSTSLCISLDDIENQSITDTKQQKYVVSYFIRENDHKYDNTSIVEIEALIKKKKLDEFIKKFLIQDKQNIYLNSHLSSEENKKRFNNVIYHQLHLQLQSLSVATNTAPQLLHLVSLLIFQHLFKIPLYVSGKFVPAILDQIKPLLSDEEQKLLQNVHTSIMSSDREQGLNEYSELKNLGLSYTL